ncbi:hypothetical protein SAMN05421734_103219 [Pelagirhabdus alkalitolerans]|uniref:YqeG family HAD IIIA-type phosphatase n=1 Tax=Pelagirhabdus alkalitolerans TaxID=1612202 RepID=A0A1G6HUF5_9BACI|nr:YqeG family HAD IIIA-type phosphatase [Pelagirhabdus alkalitolerans]SDB97475.1 hypothetical protein SAMN05421734_103219 [Pelagirhabdus alkalitolerans]
MLKRFIPDLYVDNIFELEPEFLKDKGIKGIITDLDNTLVAWDETDATERVVSWFKQMEENEIDVTIISNNNQKRVKRFSEPLERPYVFSAKKPLKRAFLRAVKKMGYQKNEVAVIGDQLITDILGGNRAGLISILVVPIVKTDDKATRINRKIERRILKHLEKRGLEKWDQKKMKT